MSHSFSFCFRNTQYQCFDCLKMSTTFGVIYRLLASLNDVQYTIYNNVIDVLWGRRAHLFSNNVQCSWSLISIFLQLMTSTSRHILRRRLVSTLSTLWTRPCVMSIDRSQSHHRKQMWCQTLITCNGKRTSLSVPIPICIKTRSKSV